MRYLIFILISTKCVIEDLLNLFKINIFFIILLNNNILSLSMRIKRSEVLLILPLYGQSCFGDETRLTKYLDLCCPPPPPQLSGNIFFYGIFSICALPQYVMRPQLQSTCHYIENHYVKMWYVRLEVANNMLPVSWGVGGGHKRKRSVVL